MTYQLDDIVNVDLTNKHQQTQPEITEVKSYFRGKCFRICSGGHFTGDQVFIVMLKNQHDLVGKENSKTI